MTSRVRYEATLSRKEAAAHMRREDDDERRMKNERMQAVRNRGAAAAAVPLEEEFTLDAPLEVMMTEDGFVGSWYPAILREIKTVDDQPSRAPVDDREEAVVAAAHGDRLTDIRRQRQRRDRP